MLLGKHRFCAGVHVTKHNCKFWRNTTASIPFIGQLVESCSLNERLSHGGTSAFETGLTLLRTPAVDASQRVGKNLGHDIQCLLSYLDLNATKSCKLLACC